MTFKTVFNSVGHFVAKALKEFDKGVIFLDQHQAQIQTGIDTAAAITKVVDPSLAGIVDEVDSAGKFLLGKAFEVLKDLDEAALAKGANLPLDAASATALRQLLFNDAPQVISTLKNIPAGLPLETAPAVPGK